MKAGLGSSCLLASSGRSRVSDGSSPGSGIVAIKQIEVLGRLTEKSKGNARGGDYSIYKQNLFSHVHFLAWPIVSCLMAHAPPP